MVKSNIHKPHGFRQGDPLIISYPEIHLVKLAKALRCRAYYCLPFTTLEDLEFKRAIIIKSRVITMADFPKMQKWIQTEVTPRLPKATLLDSHIHWV